MQCILLAVIKTSPDESQAACRGLGTLICCGSEGSIYSRAGAGRRADSGAFSVSVSECSLSYVSENEFYVAQTDLELTMVFPLSSTCFSVLGFYLLSFCLWGVVWFMFRLNYIYLLGCVCVGAYRGQRTTGGHGSLLPPCGPQVASLGGRCLYPPSLASLPIC